LEDDDAERTAAILEEYARELDDDDDGDFLFGGDVMSSFHFVQFKQVFTEAEVYIIYLYIYHISVYIYIYHIPVTSTGRYASRNLLNFSGQKAPERLC